MKKIWIILFLIHFAGLNLAGQITREKVSQGELKSGSMEEQKILQIEKDYFNAKLENNVKFMESFLADDFKSINQFGHVRNKTQSIAFFKGFKPRSFTQEELKVFLENDTTAVVEGSQTENGDKFIFSHSLRKHHNKWQIFSSVQKFPEFKELQGMGSYILTGYLRDAEGVAVSLMKNVGSQRVSINAAVVKNGMFRMEGKPIEYPEISFLVTPGKNSQTTFFLENSEITISGHIDSLSKAKVEGSKTHDEYVAYLAKLNPLREQIEIRIKEYQSMRNSNDTVRLSLLRKELNEMSREIMDFQKDYITSNTGSFVVPVILNNIAGGLSTEETDLILKSLNPAVAKTAAVLAVKDRNEALKAVAIGKKAPDFTQDDVSGNPVSLSSKTGSKLLLIDFWAGWCSPCRKENPNLVRLYKMYNEKGFEILGVSLDRNREEWTKAIAEDHLTWTQVSDLQYWNNKAARLYSVTSIPANFLIDKDGIIIAKNLRGEELAAAVMKHLGVKESR